MVTEASLVQVDLPFLPFSPVQNTPSEVSLSGKSVLLSWRVNDAAAGRLGDACVQGRVAITMEGRSGFGI